MTIDELKEIVKELPISSILEAYVPVSKKGSGYVCVCPFHDDHDPSMSIDNKRNIFKCFVCDTGGDAIKFVEMFEKTNFVDAIKSIGKKFHYNVEDISKKKENPKIKLAEKVTLAAVKLFRKIACDTSSDNFSKFLKERNIDEETAKQFQLGLAVGPKDLYHYLLSLPEEHRDKAIKMALELSLISHNPKTNDHYDYFRNRIMFPIWDQFGRVVGFTSRSLNPNDKQFKYLNSKESFLYKKRFILYGLNFSKPEIKAQDQLIIVEGQMDLISLYKNGIRNVVATSGTSLDQNVIKSLCKLTENIILAMDNDRAGKLAMEKYNYIFLKENIKPRYLDYGEFKDADEYLNNKGYISLNDKIKNAPLFVDYQINQILAEIPSTTDRKLDLFKKIFSVLAPLGSDLYALETLTQCAARLKLSFTPSQIEEHYQAHLSNESSNLEVSETIENSKGYEDYLEDFEQKDVNITEPTNISKAEKKVLLKIIEHPEVLEINEITELLDFVKKNEVKEYVLDLEKIYSEVDDSEFKNIVKLKLEKSHWANEIKQIIGQGLTLGKVGKLDKKQLPKLLFDLKKELKIESLKSNIEDMKLKLKTCDSDIEGEKIMHQIQNITKEIRNIKIQNTL